MATKRSLSELLSLAATLFPDNASREISASDIRGYFEDIIVSMQQGLVAELADADDDTNVFVEFGADDDTVRGRAAGVDIFALTSGGTGLDRHMEGTLGVTGNMQWTWANDSLSLRPNESDRIALFTEDLSGGTVTLGDVDNTQNGLRWTLNGAAKTSTWGRTSGGTGNLQLTLDGSSEAGNNSLLGDFKTVLLGDLSSVGSNVRLQLTDTAGGDSNIAMTVNTWTIQELSTAASTSQVLGFDPATNRVHRITTPSGGGSGSGTAIIDGDSDTFLDVATTNNTLTGQAANASIRIDGSFVVGDTTVQGDGVRIEVSDNFYVYKDTTQGEDNVLLQISDSGLTIGATLTDRSGNTAFERVLVTNSTGEVGYLPFATAYDSAFLTAQNLTDLRNDANWDGTGLYDGPAVTAPDGITRVFDTVGSWTWEYDGTNWWRTARVTAAGSGMYAGSGSLSGATTVTMGTNALTFNSATFNTFTISHNNGQVFRLGEEDYQFRVAGGNSTDYWDITSDGTIVNERLRATTGFPNLSIDKSVNGGQWYAYTDASNYVGWEVYQNTGLKIRTPNVNSGSATVSQVLGLSNVDGTVEFITVAGGGSSTRLQDGDNDTFVDVTATNNQVSIGGTTLSFQGGATTIGDISNSNNGVYMSINSDFVISNNAGAQFTFAGAGTSFTAPNLASVSGDAAYNLGLVMNSSGVISQRPITELGSGGGGATSFNDLTDVSYNNTTGQMLVGDVTLDGTTPATNRMVVITGTSGALDDLTTGMGDGVILIGSNLLQNVADIEGKLSAGDSVIIGDSAGRNATGSLQRSVMIGAHVGDSSTAADTVVAIGHEAANAAADFGGSIVIGFRAFKGETTLDTTDITFLGAGSTGLYHNRTTNVLQLLNTTTQVPDYADNAAAKTAGLTDGAIYRLTGSDALAIVHT